MEDYNPNNYSQNPNGFNNDPYRQFYNIGDGQKPIWAAIVSFVISIVNIVFCCCCTYIAAPVSIVFGIISLVKKWRGTAFAVSGIVISAFTIIIMAASQLMFGSMSRDISYIIINSDQYAEEYRETGEIPEEFEKYNDEEYDRYWYILGYDDFEDFFSDIIDFKDTYIDDDMIDDNDFFSDDDYYDKNIDDFGETPIDL